MSILLYANGITEELKPEEYTFTDDELIQIFDDFPIIRSYRLHESPNTWCIWGQHNPINSRDDEFNRLGSTIVDQDCFSPILFIHDTEINPGWILTDAMIHHDYLNFQIDIMKYFDDVAADLLELDNGPDGEREQRMKLIQMGATNDKRIIFELDPNIQPEVFYKDEHFTEFCEKIHDYFKLDFQQDELFTLIEDKNVVIIIREENVNILMDLIMGHFNKHEMYEHSVLIRNTIKKWKEFIETSRNSDIDDNTQEAGKDNGIDETE